ncbi:hypothetical protein SYNPS1DRAFT_25200 [Syncephalis pseudoplumigaleata]|uniref:Mso1 N-terminal domain-containing protein n=1 Tax=Syncephalis pseudoplumigaleata TaxID=1712513 RepID=A0A4P9YU08_9FUNG|nr:hypothetical protein SYNPS1DRAFT_25200 [Syncephalis pseudoplumigaleata]|eukprot:RKP22872.1 hypothetical protein SYNPS1DRAFT_25200 [Syncephalis pseudoplumigaleata]
MPGRANTGGRYGGRAPPSSAGSAISTGGASGSSGSSLRAGAGRWTRLAGQQTASGGTAEEDGGNGGAGGGAGGVSLWGKFRAATAWNNTDTSDASGSERGDDEAGEPAPPTSTSSGKKLWGKLIGSDSDTSDYEGESHVTRLLKAYYRDRYPDAQLPGWLTRPPPELYHPFADLHRDAHRPTSNASAFSGHSVQSPGAGAAGGAAAYGGPPTSRHSQDGGYGQSLRSPQQPSYDSPALSDGSMSKYARASSGSLPPAPARRAGAAASRQRGNVRRDAGAFFNDN